MNTRAWLEVTPYKHRITLEQFSSIMAYGNEITSEQYKNEIRGYLACMKDCGVITAQGERILFMWYAISRVNKIRETRPGEYK